MREIMEHAQYVQKICLYSGFLDEGRYSFCIWFDGRQLRRRGHQPQITPREFNDALGEVIQLLGLSSREYTVRDGFRFGSYSFYIHSLLSPALVERLKRRLVCLAEAWDCPYEFETT